MVTKTLVATRYNLNNHNERADSKKKILHNTPYALKYDMPVTRDTAEPEVEGRQSRP